MPVAERGQVVFEKKPPSNLTQRMKIQWIQKNRVSGTWVQCSQKGCRKWRYLNYVADPVEIPNKWQCFMNYDREQNSCSKPEPANFKDILLIRLKYTAGSLVWVKSHKYSRWPAMVDDDPEKRQFYWLDFTKPHREASMYHVVFIDPNPSNVTRQWFPASDLEPFRLANSEEAYANKRSISSVNLAREALEMNIILRLERFSFCSLYTGHIKSFKQIVRAHAKLQGYVSESESDWTLSSSSSSDEDFHDKYPQRSRVLTKKKKASSRRSSQDNSSGSSKKKKPTSRRSSYDTSS